MRPVQLWGGVECTVNRVGDTYYDQVRRVGHHERADDLTRIAELGCSALRYPALWERVAPDGVAHADFRWTDERLAQLRDLGIRPIVTLMHHGSGPRYTNLLDPAFPEHFAKYAAAIAARYPWIRDYTPINEPLTTARFSALYGHWYPHHRSDRSFVAALLNQLRATSLAMAAIREFVPDARLVQTEDAGRTYARPALSEQATFENCRRWATFDLLAGRVSDRHPLWRWLVDCGAPPSALTWFLQQPCPANVVGLNYYLTSDRYLDERISRYPADRVGGNGRDVYADVDAVRAPECPAPSHHRVIDEAWSRYGKTIALTETHVDCTREEQLRWFAGAWRAATSARQRGIDVEAVTMWALLGSFDWNSLVTRADGHYEVGAFDIRSDPPRMTALGKLAQALVQNAAVDERVHERGWWLRVKRSAPAPRASRPAPRMTRPSPLLVTGATGTLGTALTRACASRGLAVVPLGRAELDITNAAMIEQACDAWRPWAIVNAAGYVRVDDAERNGETCVRVNSDAVGNLARAARAAGARFVTFSTDLVFDGRSDTPYVETSPPNPLNMYGRSKLDAERVAASILPDALVIRTSAFFGPDDRANFLTQSLADIARGRESVAADDVIISPTYVPHLVHAVLDLLIDGERGVWHLANRGATSWASFAAAGARLVGLDESLVRPVSGSSAEWIAPRPPFSVLDSERGRIMPSLERGLEEYVVSIRDTQRVRLMSFGAGQPFSLLLAAGEHVD